MKRVMVSACLAGDLVRYDARQVPVSDPWITGLLNKGILVKYCPEVEGGMPVPRPAAQIVGGDGHDVLAGRARVVDINGRDVTDFFVQGAESALSMVKKMNICVALMKEKSPSCGSSRVYDGSFSSQLIKGMGVASAILAQNNVRIFSENEINELKSFVNQNFHGITD